MPENTKPTHLDRPEVVPVPDTECLVSWRSPDGTVVSTGPLTRDRAEKLADAYRRVSPGQEYWVVPLAPEVRSAHEGRVRRRRSSTIGH